MIHFDHLLRHSYGLKGCVRLPLSRGTMNRCYRVELLETEAVGKIYFLKDYAARFYQPDQIRRACEVQMAARGAGLPAPRVVHNVQGDYVTVTVEGFHVLSEFVSGQEYERAQIPGPAAHQMGKILAQLQDFLGKLGDMTPARLTEPAAAVGQLERLLAGAEASRGRAAVDEVACRLLRYKIGAVHRLTSLFPLLTGLVSQWVHGDYQASNLIFGAEGRVSAVVDFDQLQRRPRGLETMRALDFSFFDGHTVALPGYDFFRGYAESADLPAAEVRLFAPLWTYYRAVRPCLLDVRYERPEEYDARWDGLIQPPDDWWERNMDAVTDRLLGLASGTADP